MSGRIFLANVGANASHRFCSPIFPDGTFEFVPIPEDRDLPGHHAVRYADLKSFYNGNQDLRRYVPEKLWNWPTHNDPEFTTFSYGDNCEATPRAASLKRMAKGDFLFFIARLRDWIDDRPTDKYGFYLVGFLEIEEILRDVRSRPADDVMGRFEANAHIRRGMSDPTLWDRFWVFRGSERSRRFRKAVPFTRQLAQRVFTSAGGSPWRWDGGRTDLQVIGSYTRSCRCVINPNLPGEAQRAEALWQWVAQHDPRE